MWYFFIRDTQNIFCGNMASIKIQINSELAKKFRKLAMELFGYSKGALSKAAEASIRNWVEAVEEELEYKIDDSVDAIDGLLKDIKIDAVTLQHKLKDLWLETMS